MAEKWFVEMQDGQVAGPFQERQIASDLIAGRIPSHLRVRQGERGSWCSADRVRQIFQELAEQGWYIRTGDQQFGPFTPVRLLELHRAGELQDQAYLRQGTTSEWKPADKVLSLWQTQTCTAPTSADQCTDVLADAGSPTRQGNRTQWSTEPIRHYYLPLELAYQPVIASCYPYERLLLRQAGDESRICLVRSNDQTVGYFSISNSQQLTANARRGITHIALFAADLETTTEVAMVLCPPGSSAEDCQSYIETNFLSASIKTE